MRRSGKHCRNCTHALTIKEDVGPDFEYIPEKYECLNPSVRVSFMERYKWHPKRLAPECEHYNAKLIEKCSYCGREMKKPEWLWHIWADSIFGFMPVCSTECKERLEKDIEKSLEKAREDAELDDLRKRSDSGEYFD